MKLIINGRDSKQSALVLDLKTTLQITRLVAKRGGCILEDCYKEGRKSGCLTQPVTTRQGVLKHLRTQLDESNQERSLVTKTRFSDAA